MASTRMSSKGQVVIPREVRERHAWGPGTEFTVEEAGNVVVLRPLVLDRSATVDDLLGCVGYRGPVRSLADMDAGIARGAGRRR